MDRFSASCCPCCCPSCCQRCRRSDPLYDIRPAADKAHSVSSLAATGAAVLAQLWVSGLGPPQAAQSQTQGILHLRIADECASLLNSSLRLKRGLCRCHCLHLVQTASRLGLLERTCAHRGPFLACEAGTAQRGTVYAQALSAPSHLQRERAL